MARTLITGCSSGFGLATAIRMAEAGHDVVATMRDPARSGALTAAADAAGVTVTVGQLDVTDDASVRAAVAAAESELGGLDVVVNNAGTELRGPVELLADDELLEQFDTNVFGLVRVTRAAVPALRRSEAGVVVNVSSIGGLIARPFAGAYAATKHAVEALSESLHFELGLDGIRVHVVQPGQFPTSLAANTRTTRALGDEHARYREVAAVVEERVKALASGDGGNDVTEVAATIVRLVESPDAPLRTLVGGDAELIAAARMGRSFEEYEQLMRSTLDYWEGYRPR